MENIVGESANDFLERVYPEREVGATLALLYSLYDDVATSNPELLKGIAIK